MELRPNDAAQARTANQGLLSPGACEPQAVVRHLVGVQAQDVDWALWSIGVRLAGGTEGSVRRAVADGSIVRTWAFRGTLHFLAAEDVQWILRVVAPLVIAGNARRYKQLELDYRTISRAVRLVTRALEAEGELTRSELSARLEEAGISAAGQRAPYILQRAALEGAIRHGLPRGRQTTYAVLESMGGVGDLTALAARYMTSHGPATVHDFAWWSGVPIAWAREAIAHGSPLERSAVAARDGRGVWLLPPFDEYLLGYKDRSAVLDSAHVRKVNAGGGMPRPTVVVDGQVAGVWRRTVKRGAVEVSVEPFRGLRPQEQRHVEEAAGRYAVFRGLSLRLVAPD